MKKTNKILIIIYILSAISLLGFLVWKNYSPIGKQIITYNFSKENPFTKGFRPETRIKDIICEKDLCFQEIYNDPVYLDLLLPRKFQTLEIELFGEKLDKQQIHWGLKDKKEVWHFLKEEVKNNKVKFNLDNTFIEKRRITLMLSIPDIKDNDQSVKIKEINFILERETKFKNFLKKTFNYVQKLF